MPDVLTGPERAAADDPRPNEPTPPPVPALAAKADDLEALRTAVVDAAGVGFGLWASYLFVLFYLLVAAGGVTHRDLFFESPVRLPFLNVDLPLKGFFWLGPALLLIIHAYVLLHFVMLADKVGVFDGQLRAQINDPEVRTRVRRQLPSNIFVQFLAGPREVRNGVIGLLLWLIALISLVIGPVALLVFFQLQFLPYHDPAITWWQRIAVVADLALLWTLWPRVGLPKAQASEARRRGFVEAAQRIGTILLMLLITVIAVPLVFAIAIFPGEWQEKRLGSFHPIALLREALIEGEVDMALRKPKSLWSNRLVLPGLDVIDHTKQDETKIADLPQTASLRARHLEGAVLIGAGLRKVDFTAAHLEGATLDSADLRGANFGCASGEFSSCAQLQGASLDNAQLQGASLNHAELQGVSLVGPQLQGVSFEGARLQRARLSWGFQGARLKGAVLQGASLEGAELQGASLDEAQLQGASLKYAKLQGASLDEAQLQGASLKYAKLQGASLYRAQLQGAQLYGAEFQGASLDGAKFQGVSLDGAEFEGASLDGAEFQGASLDGANFLGASLRDVFVWRADARTANMTGVRIKNAENGRKTRNGDFWTIENLYVLMVNLQLFVPEADRTAALARVNSRLDPATPLEAEEQMAQHWTELQRSLMPDDVYEARLAERWGQIGCATAGAPYVLAGLINIMTSHSPFSPDSAQVPRLAAEFLKDECAGARGLSDGGKGKLKAISDRKPANPSAQAPQP